MGRAMTEQEAAMYRRQIELAYEDCRAVSHPRLDQPFNSITDAVERLLSYHVRLLLPVGE